MNINEKVNGDLEFDLELHGQLCFLNRPIFDTNNRKILHPNIHFSYRSTVTFEVSCRSNLNKVWVGLVNVILGAIFIHEFNSGLDFDFELDIQDYFKVNLVLYICHYLGTTTTVDCLFKLPGQT